MNRLTKPLLVLSAVVFGALGAAGGVLAADNGRAGDQSMGDALFTGPLVASNATAVPAGHWDVEPYLVDAIQYGGYDDDWNQRNTPNSQALRSVTLFEYGLTDRLSVSVLPTFGYNIVDEGPDSDNLRWGDTTLRAHYMLTQFHKGSPIPTIALAVSQSLPTGDYDELGNPANAVGSGVWATTLGLWTQHYFWMPNGRILRARLNLSYRFADDDVSVDGRSVYGTPKGFDGEVDVGETVTVDAAVEYSLTRHWVPVFEVLYSHTTSGKTSGTVSTLDTSGGLISTSLDRGASSSDEFQVAPALEYNWNAHFGVIAGAQVTVAGRNTGAVVTPQAALNIYY